MSGWFKHPRDLRGSFDQNPLKDLKLSLIYLYLVEKANWEDSETLSAGQVKVSVPEIQKSVCFLGLEETRNCVDILCKRGWISLSRASKWSNSGYVATIVDYATKFLGISTHDPIYPCITHALPMNTIPETLENSDVHPCITHALPIAYSREKRKKKKKAEAVCISPEESEICIDLATEWNKRLPKFQQVNVTVLRRNDDRVNDIRESIEKHTLEILLQGIDKISTSEYLCSKTKDEWRPDFTWLLKTENLQKVIEGNYDKRFVKAEKPEYKGPFDVRDIVLCNQQTKLN